MDDYVNNILTEWEMTYLINTFKDNAIDKEVFLALTEEMMKDLIPQVGYRYKFKKKYQILVAPILFEENPEESLSEYSARSSASRNELSAVSLSSADDSDNTIVGDIEEEIPVQYTTSPPDVHYQKINLENLLTRSKGKELLTAYQKTKKLDRAKLASLIIDSELDNDPDKRISGPRFSEFANEIENYFTGERRQTYYVPYRRGPNGPLAARGVLFDKYVNRRRLLRKIGILEKHHSRVLTEETFDAPVNNLNEIHLEEVQWLKNNIEPLPEVLDKWQNTCNIRLSDNGCTIADYYNKYKSLQLPTGHLLLDIDFQYKYKNSSNRLFTEWSEIATKIVRFAKSFKDSIVQTYLAVDENQKLITEGNIDVLALLLLPLLLGTAAVKSKKSGNHWRPSKTEVQKGFLLHLQTAAELEPELEQRIRKLQRFKLQSQPFPTIIGPLDKLTSCIVQVNNVRYTLPSALKAIDVCFKSYHSLNAKYPIECEHVWLFLQKYVYKIDTAVDKNYVSVNKFISNLQSI